jgi:hypothetical protein
MSQINLKIIRNPRKEKRLKDYLNKMKLKFKIRQINKLREKIKEIKSNHRINKHKKMIKINSKNKFLKLI